MSARVQTRLGVLGSGKGSNFVALAGACASGSLPAQMALVLSDVADAGILREARERDIPCHFVDPGPYRTKLAESAEADYLQRLNDAGVEYVVLAGFMRILKRPFLQAFPDRVVNIHPSLLPSFPGLEAWRQALEYGVKITGCTVHLVDEGVDSGPILGQAAVPVAAGDTPSSLHARIQEAERRLYPSVLADLVQGKLPLGGRKPRLSQP